MSKKYRGKTCVYCGVAGVSETRDHVLARQFALVDRRRDLPIVPACKGCNSTKSELERYLTILLPFGARHSDARQNLTTMLPKRLANNSRLKAELAAGAAPQWVPTPSGRWQYASAIQIEADRLEAWLGYLTLGLMWHHWEIAAAGRVTIETFLPQDNLRSPLAQALAAKAARRVPAVSIGGGALDYEGALAFGDQITAIWRFTIYGGLQLAGSDARERGSTHYVVVTPVEATPLV